MKEIVVIGGGAAGIAAALSAAMAAPSARVTLLEGLDRVGKKILATGNGRCNLTNAHISPERYHSASPKALERLLASMPAERALDFFSALGLRCAAEEQGRIYPYSRQASTVLDVLLLALKHGGVQVICSARISSLTRTAKGFQIRAESGKTWRADTVILTAGGKASPKQGSDGSGYPLALQLGHSCTPLYPCLVALKCASPLLKGLKGIRAHLRATLYLDGQAKAEEVGELQFTDYGLSGIPAFQLSCHLGARPKSAQVGLDFFPDCSEMELARFIRDRISATPGEALETFLPGLIAKKLLYAVMKSASLDPLSRPAASLSPSEIKRLARYLKDWRFTVTGTLDWSSAQVTGGGIPLDEIGMDFASKRCTGLYLAGEILDAAGDCGGYNLHWAWCSGIIAGRAAGGNQSEKTAIFLQK